MRKSFRLSSLGRPPSDFDEEPTLPGHGDWTGRRGGPAISRRLALLCTAIDGMPVDDLEPGSSLVDGQTDVDGDELPRLSA